MKDYIIATDGAYSPARNQGGIGIVIADINYIIVGDNGIVEGPMSEFEANKRIIELIEEFPDTKFEIKEVK